MSTAGRGRLPRWSRRGRWSVAVATAVVLGSAAWGPPAGADPLQFTVLNRPALRIGSLRPVAPVPPGFVGTSMDYCAITRYSGGARTAVLARLLRALSPERPVIRVGGPGPDARCSGRRRSIDAAPRAIAAIARLVDARLILGVDFDGTPARAAREVRVLVREIDPRPPHPLIEAFEVANEPDLETGYGVDAPPEQVRPYFELYLHRYALWAHTIRAAARDWQVGIAGPSLGRLGLPWFTGVNAGQFGAFLHSPARTNPVTFHAYPLLWQIPCPLSGCPSIPNLLWAGSSTGMAQTLAPLVRRLPPRRVARVDEMNSVDGGGVSGVSDTFASALWALDTLFEFLRAGISGVNVHTFPAARYALYSAPRDGEWRVRPEFYGLLLFSRAAPAGAQLLRVHAAPAAAANPAVDVRATRGLDGRLRVVVINKDLVDHVVALSGPGVPARRTATLSRLLAPVTTGGPGCQLDYGAATGLCATGGVRLGGATFGPHARAGGDLTRTGRLRRPPRGTCRRLLACAPQPPGHVIVLTVPAGSAAMVAGTPAGRPRRGARRARTR